jgi:glycosyltransferase involved in cell wall biosynthesis
VRDLVRHLARHGVHVVLITPPPTVPHEIEPADFLSPLIRLSPVRYVTFPLANRRGTTILDRSTSYLAFGLRAGRVALDLVRRGEVDLVHGFGASVLGYAIARREAGAPLVFNPQGLEEFGATSPSQPLLKRIGYAPLKRAVRVCARAADVILATDAALEPTVRRHLRPRASQVRVVPNGIDLEEVTSQAGRADGAAMRRNHGLDAGTFVLLSVGRLEANKGFEVLAEALAQEARPGGALAGADWRWVVVGAGPHRRALERRVRRHGIGAYVMFAGRLADRDLHAWYEAASVFVHPTLYEGSSLVTLEAMAHRKAIVATTAGGLTDKVRPGVSGWLVPPGDAAALGRAIRAAVSGRAGLDAMGDAGFEIVAREFSWSAIVTRQIQIYRELLSNRPS